MAVAIDYYWYDRNYEIYKGAIQSYLNVLCFFKPVFKLKHKRLSILCMSRSVRVIL